MHQFTRIGCHAMISGASAFSKDVPPYSIVGKRPLVFRGVNIVGLRRRGFTLEQIDRIRDVYRVIYQSGLNVTEACKKAQAELPDSEEKKTILDFIAASKRGIIRYDSHQDEDE